MDFSMLMAEDVEHIFTAGEVERECVWNGEPLRIIEGARDDVIADSALGRSQRTWKIYCRAWCFTRLPTIGQDVEIDGVTWQVFDIQPLSHLLAITLVKESSL